MLYIIVLMIGKGVGCEFFFLCFSWFCLFGFCFDAVWSEEVRIF